jgi:DNA-binding NtrC family response regulator
MEPNRILWIGADGASNPSRQPVCGLWKIEYREIYEGLSDLRQTEFDAIVLDFPIPCWSPAELLEQVQRLAPQTPVLICDPQATLSDAVRLTRLGMRQFLADGEDPFGPLEEAIEERRAQDLARIAEDPGEEWQRLLIGDSREMRQVKHLIRMVGGRRATVLITGETGTGKELAARALHQSGPRRRGPMVAVNCSALPENLLEAELFGHVRGAFTGAVQQRVGRFEQANGGTIFLDEIGDLPLELQAKLLRVLQERGFERLGSSETTRVDVRVVAATNCDLAEKIEMGEFREDLYYRLNVVPIQMPPLRQRPGDIPLLAAHFLDKICRSEQVPAKLLSPESVARLSDCSWPGNVRQLENAMEMAIVLSGDRTVLVPADFPLPRRAKLPAPISSAPQISVPDTGLDFEQTLSAIERSILEQALRMSGGNKKAAAAMLRLKRTTLSAKIRSLQAAVA